MKFKRRIALTLFFVLLVFGVAFSMLMYVGKLSFQLKELKNQSTMLLADMYRLNFEIKNIMTATGITTEELRTSLLETVGSFEQSLLFVEKNSRKLLSDAELSMSLKNAKALWNMTRRDLDLVSNHLEKLIELGIDKRTGLISRSQYGYLLHRDGYSAGQERYHLLSLENAIESFTASSYSYGLVFTDLNEKIAASADAYIRYSLFSSVAIILTVVTGALVFFLLFSHQALVRQLDRLIDEVREQETEKRDAELRALRYQINPHFLYNTLGSIRSVAVGAGQEEIAEMLRIVSRFFRKTISRTNALISVGDERLVVSDYLAILQIRYKNRLTVGLDFPAGVERFLMPSLILQPLIENAVLHGLTVRLNDQDGDARLDISARVSHASLFFEIRDNGTGMDEEEIAKSFAASPRDPNESGIHIGIHNIHERIQRQCGKAYGLSIQGKKGEYTLVKIRLPLLPEAEDHGA